VTTRTDAIGQQAAHSDVLDGAIRLGLVAYGVVHLLIAWLALQLALGHSADSPSNQGAMHELAGKPFGTVLIWTVAIGMFCLVVWRILEGAVGHRDEDDQKRWLLRLGSWGKAIVYAVVGISAVKVATGGGSGGSSRSQGRSTTARLLDLPAGPWIVGAVALGILGYGANMIRRGLAEKYREHLTAEGKSGESGRAYLWLGKYGYLAKGVAIGVVGSLFGYAAVSHDPNKSGGLDQALRTVLEQPFGPVLLAVIALGLGSYGLFCLARARHLSK